MTDEEIIISIKKGDKEKFGILMSRYEEKLFRYGRKFLSGKENIEDIVQDIFISTYKNINSFNTSLKFSSWIYRIAHNAFVSSLRKAKTNPFTLLSFDFDTFITHAEDESQYAVKNEEETRELVNSGLEKLPAKYREVLILHYLEELSYKEISDVLEIPIGTVGIRIKRAKELFKKIYEPLSQ